MTMAKTKESTELSCQNKNQKQNKYSPVTQKFSEFFRTSLDSTVIRVQTKLGAKLQKFASSRKD
jgi:hypothetical protein